MDSMTAAKAQWLLERMPTLEECFNMLIEKSFYNIKNIGNQETIKNNQETENNNLEKIIENQKNAFQTLYATIKNTLLTYQRCKVGSLCRNFDELSSLFSIVYKSSLVDNSIKFKIRHQVIPIFSIVDQSIDLSSHMGRNVSNINK
ncbi:hypothetical protein M9Y10_022695 [Tritrichomonas musculus]|uniref:Uncharacterized protein n=1 Tax=Tritrichomonas musculus TaxID=1915356 RepID=A0ABR2KWB9_9EUKA